MIDKLCIPVSAFSESVYCDDSYRSHFFGNRLCLHFAGKLVVTLFCTCTKTIYVNVGLVWITEHIVRNKSSAGF